MVVGGDEPLVHRAEPGDAEALPQRDQRVGREREAQPAPDVDARVARRALDEVLRRRVVVAHLQEALALDEHQLGRADGVEAEERRALAVQLAEVPPGEGEHAVLVGLLGARRQQHDPQAVGRPRRRSWRATSSSTATPVRLSLAPGTTGWRDMWAMSPAETAEIAVPAAVIPRRPSSAPSATSAGPATTPPMSGGQRSRWSCSHGARSKTSSGRRRSKTKLERAASWWAKTTSVCAASGARARPRRSSVVPLREPGRSQRAGPPWRSSAITPARDGADGPAGAHAAQDGDPASRRSRGDADRREVAAVDALLLDARPRAEIAQRAAIQTAASRSPSEPGGRSIAARCATAALRSTSLPAAGVTSPSL